jgi:hypothetical protein
MENKKIKSYFIRMSKNSNKVLISINEDSLIYLEFSKLIKDENLNRIISIIFY